MFWNKENKLNLELLQTINPSSKAALKMQCLLVSGGDVDKAERLYDFMIKDMGDLPTLDPIKPTVMQQIKDGAIGLTSWVNNNQESIINWVSFAKNLFVKSGGAPANASAPIPNINP